MVKNYSDNWHSIKNTKDLTMKQMFDISEKLVSEQDEIYWVKTINWESSSWKYLSLIGDEQIINLQRTDVFSDSVLCLGKMNENPRLNMAWKQRLEWFKSSPEYRTLDRIDGEPMEFEWNIFPGFNSLQLSQQVQELLLRLDETPENFKGRIIVMSMFNDISWWSKRQQEKECDSNAQIFSLFAKRFGAGQWSFLGLGSEKKWYSISEDSPQGEWDKMAEKMMVTHAESGHSVFGATSPFSWRQLKSKGGYREDKIWAKDRRYSSCLWNPWTKTIRILTQSIWEHRVMHNTCIKKAWKKHQNTVYWVDIRSNAIILQGTLPAYCIPKVVRLKTGEVLYEKSYMSPRPPPKIPLRHDWTRGKVGSTVDQQPEGKVLRQSRGEVQNATFSQLTQLIPKTNLWSIRTAWGHARCVCC